MDTDNLMFDLPKNRSAAIKVIGVGGGGGNAVNYMYQEGINGVDFVICNTDAQALNNSPIPNKIQLGVSTTEGLGAGANPEVGEQAAIESAEDVKLLMDSNTKMVFITAGMGGGTGTGAAPVIAGIAKEMGILTVGICTVPFHFEGKRRLEQAEEGVEKLRANVDSLIVINNNKLRELYGNLGYKTGFAKADEVLATAAKGIAEVITHNYSVNIDLRDVKTVLEDSGTAIMGSARASGDNKAKEAISNALDSPLLNNNKITGAQNVLLLIVSHESEITIDEIGVINDYIQNEAGHDANIIMGIGEDDTLGEDISITVVATGFPMDDQKYTGKSEQKIFHRLEDDQPLTQELTPEVTARVKPIPVEKRFTLEDDEPETTNEPVLRTVQETTEPEIVEPIDDIQLKSDEESFDFTIAESAMNKEVLDEPVLKSPEEPLNDTQSDLFEEEKKVVFELEDEVEETEEPNLLQQEESFIFSLNDEEEIVTPEIKEEPKMNAATNLTLDFGSEFETKPKVQEEINEVQSNAPIESIEPENNPFNSPISDVLSNKIEERRARLKQFNFKFQKSLSEQQVDKLEKEPTFERNNVELDERNPNTQNDYVVGEKNDEVKIRPNNYLHKNVD